MSNRLRHLTSFCAGLALAAFAATAAPAQDALIYGRSDPAARAGGRRPIGALTQPPALAP
jgi:hypothetical protein